MKKQSIIFVTLAGILLAVGYLFFTQKTKPDGFPILMYHDIAPHEGRFSVSPDTFRKHLSALHKSGYRTAKLKDMLRGTLDKKTHKYVVLRFDDSRKSHFRYIKDHCGSVVIDPDCAVAILLDFSQKHPEFGHHAAFCVIASEQFHQPRFARKKLNFLLDHEMEIVNHSYNHEALIKASPDDIDKQFGQAMACWEQLLGDQAEQIVFLAPPYGLLPKSNAALDRLKRFFWNDKWYSPQAILCAGRRYHKLCPWPNSPEFNVFELPCFDVTTENFDDILAELP